MVNWLHEQQLRKQYASGFDPFEGVVLKKARGNFTCCPKQLAIFPEGIYAMVSLMNVRCAMTVNTPVVSAILRNLKTHKVCFVPLSDGLHVQVLKTMNDLPRCQLHHFAAFIEDTEILVVWDDDPEQLLQRAEKLEGKLMELIWEGENTEESESTKKKRVAQEAVHELDPNALEKALSEEKRPVRLESASMVACTLALCLSCVGLGFRNIALGIAIDGNYSVIALIAAVPAQFFVSLFMFQVLVTNLFQVFGPISAVGQNSKYYSGKPPIRLARTTGLPHVTIQMPVYKEGLDAVIRPTVISLKTAISTYEMQGGTANIFVNDDGMQVISENLKEARRDFYDEHNIGWVARPKDNPQGENGLPGFRRRGKFKKASNMNYALHVSNRVEEKLQKISRTPRWTQDDEKKEYAACLAQVLEEDEGRTEADGNIRIGDYILLIDSDTRVPSDCLFDAVSEMEQSPSVALIQFSSGVMQVTRSYFENGVTWFTNLIYSCITFAVASGDSCPFVGHNAILRWSAIQDAAAYMDEDGYEKFWSEYHVSEDFDMALRLQVAGYSLRYASYTGDGFKEGVSLTVYDELKRWEKYAYGCNELVFHPFRFWITKGPFTKLFKKFIFSSIPLPKKVTILAYIGTYYAIASAWLITLMNYFITGWFHELADKYYLDSFSIYIATVFVFTGFGNIALGVLRYRLNQKDLLQAVFENFQWVPMFTIFLGGISLHLSQAILSHFFEIDINWGATSKEVEDVNFRKEILRIVKDFKWTFFFCFSCTALIISGYYAFPLFWRIQAFYCIYPLTIAIIGHFALPVFLNPALMKFTW
ncbi:hypothetical protein M441DRAFT_85102 [Trichoderma asperellum CBS 433.97]|uniref:Uncharacterized protein n=1 Tax=Trichoderma asperellum (strain ATCC 204424 / CBS 433.97 / NBRC 101777) TaxID=1042311 RepID=A0A2T3YQB4_TRIA4|nr:hypothetical protein M441DRAFT_85102 [Trichoderma asperellum CBS 433.97]PTB34760.1 hypothetical protein M441DRAFT_85102 [Trichoderma asperellum CBS 433.97]